MAFDYKSIDNSESKEFFFTLIPDNQNSLSDLFSQLIKVVETKRATILKIEGFGPGKSYNDFLNQVHTFAPDDSIPCMYVTEQKIEQGPIAGIQVHAISGCPVQEVNHNGKSLGFYFEDENVKTLIGTGIGSGKASLSREEQTLTTLQNIELLLQIAEMGMLDIQRTWFFNDRILEWYSDFNAVRTEFYKARSIFDRYLPASTGMGGGHPKREALSVGLLAQRALGPEVHIQDIPSPRQCAAFDYGSSFSRAVEISCPNQKRVYVSGTASIDPAGNTININDIDGQIKHTIEVVLAILKSREMDFSHLTRGIAYFKYPEDKDVWIPYAQNYELPINFIPMVCNDVCRDELLFEIEVDAIKPI